MFRTGLGILRLYEDILLQMDFIHIAQFLTKLPEDITSEKLFSCIAAIQMQNSNKKWAQVSFLDIHVKTDMSALEYMWHLMTTLCCMICFLSNGHFLSRVSF